MVVSRAEEAGWFKRAGSDLVFANFPEAHEGIPALTITRYFSARFKTTVGAGSRLW